MRKLVVLFVLISILTACNGGDDKSSSSSPTEPSSLLDGIVIESQTIYSNSGYCLLCVKVQNTTEEARGGYLNYNAFDATGRGIAMANIRLRLSAKSASSFAGVWVRPGDPRFVQCSEISSFKLDPSSWVSWPDPLGDGGLSQITHC